MPTAIEQTLQASTYYCANCTSRNESGSDTFNVEYSQWLIFGESRRD
ncbi:MAG: hypothetical protein AB4038_13005 [Prochloraceae cyanobacterium]